MGSHFEDVDPNTVSRAGNAGDQHQPSRHVANVLHYFGQVEFIEGPNLSRNYAQYNSHIAALLENVHTETSQACDAVCHVDFSGFFELLLLAGRHHAERHGEHIFRAHARLVG